jgi:hypothetical protein
VLPDDPVKAIDIGPGLYSTMLVRPKSIIYNIKRYTRLDRHIAYEFVLFLITMGSQILTATISHCT